MTGEEKVPIPIYLIQNGISMGLTFTELGLVYTMAGFADDKQFTFNDFINEAAQQGPIDERVTPFQIREIIKRLEKEKFFRVIKFKEYYKVEWLAKSFGEI